jgi:hypothetical protein
LVTPQLSADPLGRFKKLLLTNPNYKEETSMRITTMVVILGFIVFLCFSCKDKSTNSETQSTISFSSQSSKCLSNGLSKSSGLDSVFTYSFTQNLIIDFSVNANCCPDSNRFNISNTVGIDTIIVSVADTARSLCSCICLYMIHVEFGNLPNDHYVVRCKIGNSHGYDDPTHLVNVYRKK